MMNPKNLTVIFALIVLTSCASSPPFLSPSKALVTSSVIQMGKNIAPKYNEFLNSRGQESKILKNGQRVSLGEYYTSALGQQCRILFVSESLSFSSISSSKRAVSRKRIVCKQPEQERWVLIPSIVEQANSKPIFAD